MGAQKVTELAEKSIGVWAWTSWAQIASTLEMCPSRTWSPGHSDTLHGLFGLEVPDA